jgi:peptidoglycan/xylan/chitin deacetylase (PgdA/CDA1 family)
VTEREFRGHLRVLAALGLRVVPLATIVERLGGGEPVDGLAAITFDDALAGVLRHAVPALDDAAMVATSSSSATPSARRHLGVPGWRR